MFYEWREGRKDFPNILFWRYAYHKGYEYITFQYCWNSHHIYFNLLPKYTRSFSVKTCNLCRCGTKVHSLCRTQSEDSTQRKNRTTTKVVKKDVKPTCNPSQSLLFSTPLSHLHLQPTAIFFFEWPKAFSLTYLLWAPTWITNVDWPNIVDSLRPTVIFLLLGAREKKIEDNNTCGQFFSLTQY